MSELIQFVANYDDLSTDRGYQFKFYCDKCHNGYLSEFQVSMLGTAAGLLRSVGGMFGGMLGTAGNSAYEIQRAIAGKQHDTALKEAVDAGKLHFHQCHRCGHWSCPEVCWNPKAGLCNACAPDEALELTAQKALAESEQIYTKTRETDYVSDLNFAKNKSDACGKCGAMVSPDAKFCAECGTPHLAAQAHPHFCTECGQKVEAGVKFCAGCGAKAV